MSSRRRILIWGGNGASLHLDSLDSHASVTAFFLTQELKKYYDVVNCTDMDATTALLDFHDVDVVFSTFQKGFTSRLCNKGHAAIVDQLKQRNSLLCSVVDYADRGAYAEDLLFSVRAIPKQESQGIDVAHMGWCAAPEFCYPESDSQGVPVIVIDHPPYSRKSSDRTSWYLSAIMKIREQGVPCEAYIQGNAGIVKVDERRYNGQSLYSRANKVSWKEMMALYRRASIFCVTHPESAGLSAIEAALCGAKIYVPIDRMARSYIAKDLTVSIDVCHVRYPFAQLSKVFKADLQCKEDRALVHAKVKEKHCWQLAGQRIYEALRRRGYA